MPKGSHARAKLYSLIEAARANDIEPYTNLVDVITKLPSTTTDDELDRLLPWQSGRNHSGVARGALTKVPDGPARPKHWITASNAGKRWRAI
jgi:hypothetical protein